jgi:hypothetical protein
MLGRGGVLRVRLGSNGGELVVKRSGGVKSKSSGLGSQAMDEEVRESDG